MDIVLRAAVIFVVLWIVIRVSGKREIAQLSAFDLIVLVTLGDLVSQNVMQEDYSLTGGLLAVSTVVVMAMALSWLAFRFPRTRPLLEGRPRVVVRDGEVDLAVLHGERMAVPDLFEAAREQGVRSLRDVELCVLETDGGFSFFERSRGGRGSDDRS